MELLAASSTEYIPLPMDEDEGRTAGYRHPRAVALSASDKWRLVKPMISKYMAPLCKPLFVCLRKIHSRLHYAKFVCIWSVNTLTVRL